MSTRTYLLSLILAVIVPVMAFSTLLLGRYAAEERARYEREAELSAYNVALVVDAEVAGLLSLLRGLSTSSALARQDIAGFQEEARRMIEGQDQIVILRDLERRQYLNTSVPFATALLPPAPELTLRERAELGAGRPVVGDVYPGIRGEPRVPVALPLTAGGEQYVLVMTVPTSRIHEVLMTAVPPGFTVTIGDSNGTVVSRSEGHDEFTGRAGRSDYLSKATEVSGTFTAEGFGGEEFLAGYKRSTFSGWLYAANIPVREVEAPLWRSLGIAAAVGIIALAISALTAFRFAGRLTADARGLEKRAIALGRGEPVEPMPTRLNEFAVVSKALRNAASEVEVRAREMEKAREREALLGSIFDAAHLNVGICEIDGNDVLFVVANKEAARVLGHAQVDGRTGKDLGLGELETAFWLGIARRLETEGGPITTEFGFSQTGEGAPSWFVGTFTALPRAADSRQRLAFTAIDITDRKRNEEQRRLLVNELNHRVKNTLATVQSIASQTLSHSGSVKEAKQSLTSRLIALAQAHDVLTRESWEGADLRELAVTAVSPHAANRLIVIEGPPVRLTPQMALIFALTLHELGTNAAKYGALSTEGGSLDLSWSVDGGTLGGRTLHLRWEEKGGPPVTPPTHTGFGSRLLKRMFANEKHGKVEIEHAPTGVICKITVTLPSGAAQPIRLVPEPTIPPVSAIGDRTRKRV